MQNLFHEDKLNINLQSNIQSAAILKLNDAKLGKNIYTRKSSLRNIYLSKDNQRNTEKKCE